MRRRRWGKRRLLFYLGYATALNILVLALQWKNLGAGRYRRTKAMAPSPHVWPPEDQLNTIVKDGPRRLVVIASNADYVEFADNFLTSIRQFGVENFVIVSLDSKAYHILKAAYPENTLPLDPELAFHQDQSEEALFGSPAFKALTSFAK